MEQLNRDPQFPRAREPVPIFNVPTVLIVVIGILAVSYFGVELLPRRLQAWVQSYGAVSPRLFLSGPSEQGGFFGMIAPLVTHIFMHANGMHLLLNAVWLLAFGTPVARRLNAGRSELAGGILFFSLFVLSGVAGALAYIAAHASEFTFLVGASGGVSGLLGGLVRFVFHRPAAGRDGHMFAPLTNRNVLVWSLVIIGLNVVIGLFGRLLVGGGNDIAWEAHIGGYLFGLLTFPLFDAPRRRI